MLQVFIFPGYLCQLLLSQRDYCIYEPKKFVALYGHEVKKMRNKNKVLTQTETIHLKKKIRNVMTTNNPSYIFFICNVIASTIVKFYDNF